MADGSYNKSRVWSRSSAKRTAAEEGQLSLPDRTSIRTRFALNPSNTRIDSSSSHLRAPGSLPSVVYLLFLRKQPDKSSEDAD